MREDYKILADYLTVEGLLILKDGWEMSGVDADSSYHLEQINKALDYLGWEG